MPSPTQELQQLMNKLVYKQCTLVDFKKSAMILVQDGADLTVLDTTNNSQGSLLQHLINTNINGANDPEITELLTLKKELVAVKNGHKQTPLQYLMNQLVYKNCTLEDFKKSAMILVQYGADLTVMDSINHSKGTLLHHLVISNKKNANDKEIAELLRLNKELINVKDGHGRIPLHSLLRKIPNTPLEIVKKMLQLGSDLQSTDDNGETLLHACCVSGNLDVAKFLVEQGLDLGAKTKNEGTLLHSSIYNDNNTLWQWLYENKINIDAQDTAEQTALHLATRSNNYVMVKWLIQNNANLDVQDKNGKTALSIAQEYENEVIVSLLSNTNKSKPPAKSSDSDDSKHPPKSSDSDKSNKPTKNQSQTNERLFATIKEMRDYGMLLKSKGTSKGQVAIDLASQLQSMAKEFFKQQEAAQTTGLPQFKQQFLKKLNSKNDEMSDYRVSWSTIIANVAIAITVIGAALMIGKLLYSKAKEGRALFFFQKSHTTCEEKIEAVKQSAVALN